MQLFFWKYDEFVDLESRKSEQLETEINSSQILDTRNSNAIKIVQVKAKWFTKKLWYINLSGFYQHMQAFKITQDIQNNLTNITGTLMTTSHHKFYIRFWFTLG